MKMHENLIEIQYKMIKKGRKINGKQTNISCEVIESSCLLDSTTSQRYQKTKRICYEKEI